MKLIASLILGSFLLSACAQDGNKQIPGSDYKSRLDQINNMTYYWNLDGRCTASAHSDSGSGILSVTVHKDTYCPGWAYGLEVTFTCDGTMICKMANPPKPEHPVYGAILISNISFSLSYASDSNHSAVESVFTR
jgi:hypothetical protein